MSLGTRASWEASWRATRAAASGKGSDVSGSHPIDVQRAIVVHSERMRWAVDGLNDAAATRPDRTHRARILAGRGTREDWLQMVASWARRDLFDPAGYGGAFPRKVYLTVGWPLGVRKPTGARAIGQCWHKSISRDGNGHIFVCPTLEADRAVDVLIHELVHDVVGVEAGHGKEFRDCAVAVGLAGKMTATTASETLLGWIRERMESDWPDYTHGIMEFGPDGRPSGPGVPPGHPGGGGRGFPGGGGRGPGSGSRLKKVWCECGYTMRVTRKWLDIATPDCPVCKVTMETE